MEICWGHSTGVVEDVVRTFADHWTGTGSILNGDLDAERIQLDAGENMVSEVVNTGIATIQVLQNIYDITGDDASLYYRTGNSSDLSAVGWTAYTVPFESEGFVQVKVEAPS